jgi:predicted  nucleic acid-binding Zn-ribbon protein
MDLQLGSKPAKFDDHMKEINDLKARAYDIIAALESLQRELSAVNNTIAEKTEELQKLHQKHERGTLDIID